MQVKVQSLLKMEEPFSMKILLLPWDKKITTALSKDFKMLGQIPSTPSILTMIIPPGNQQLLKDIECTITSVEDLPISTFLLPITTDKYRTTTSFFPSHSGISKPKLVK